MPPIALVWLRRDLRLGDNLAVYHALESGAQIVVVFVLDRAILDSPRASPARVTFMCDALAQLSAELNAYGASLIVCAGVPAQVIPALAAETGAGAVYANRDYTPYARRRDESVRASLGRVPLHLYDDRLLTPPDAVRTSSGGAYTIFTPFSRRWHETPKPYADPVTVRLEGRFASTAGLTSLPLPDAASLDARAVVPMPAASADAALRRLDAFAAERIYAYADRRNALSGPFDDPRAGTSSLSPYVRWGLISPRRIRQAAADAYRAAPDDAGRRSVAAWMNEFVWHEFYTHILWHFPHVRTSSFNRKFDRFPWRTSPDEFVAWAEGRTGYPVVDAAMRQLSATGWMHNRARMIVASFLARHLLIDWREGERYFMRTLLDGDTAANNGGWQWAAGTGTDAQPYFRIFNPVTQSARFDPDGAYIRRWVPELLGIETRYIHAPWLAPLPPKGYPQPIVDHRLARQRALAAFGMTKT